MRHSTLGISIAAIAIALLGSGCATTQTIQQGRDLSTSAIAYSDATAALLELTTDRVIEFDTDELIKTRRGENPRQMITDKNQAVSDVIGEIRKFQAQTKLLKAYFQNLQALADSPVKDDVGGSVQSLSDSISKLNKVLDGPDGKEKLTDDQKKQIGALAGLVAQSIQAEKIKNALTRDAEVIGKYLALQELQITQISEILRDRFSAENDLFGNRDVIAPYVDQNRPLPDKWAENRAKWLKTQFVNQQLSTAREAAKQLRGVWTDVLQGKNDINSLRSLISDVNDFVVTVQALETARKAK